MTPYSTRLAVALAGVLAGVGSSAVPARAADRNEIRSVDVLEANGAVELAIQGSRAPSYTVFKLQDPPRLVVDLAGADVSRVSSLKVGKGGVTGVTTAQYQDAKNTVGRVIVALDGPRRYEVTPRGDAVVVRVLPDTQAPAPPAPENALPVPPPPPATEASPARVASHEPAPAPTTPATAEPSPVVALPEAAAPSAPGDPSVVSRTSLTAKVKKPARTLTAVSASPERVLLKLDGDVGLVDVIELRDPPRLALDLHGVTKAPRGAAPGAGPISQIRFGKDADKVRAVLDMAGEMPHYQVTRVAGGIAVVARAEVAAATAQPAAATAQPAAATAQPAAATSPPAAPRTVAIAPAAPAAAPLAKLADLKFTQQRDGARIEIAGKARYTVTRPDARTVVLSLEGAALPRKLERTLDTSALAGPVLMVSSFNQPATGQVKVVATLRGTATDRIVETRDGLAWTFSSEAPTLPSAAHPERSPAAGGAESKDVQAQSAEAASAGFGTEAPSYALSGAPQARGYTGRRITLDFHDIEIRNLLRLIADVSKKNIVVADDVTGKVTVTLRNVPWDQALDLVLKSKGLGKEELGNVIRIAKFEKIAEEQKARADAEKARMPTLPLKVRIIPVNFARANDVAGRVKDVLTERGSVSTDERTNVLIVKDIQEALVRAEGLVRNLDTEIPQVLIESRIVEASSNFSRAIGVQWGGNASLSQATNNPTGLVFPANAIATGGATATGNTTGTAAAPNYAVSLPAPVGDGAGGALGLIFGSAGGAFNLNLRLSALENRGVVKTVSAPKIATIDNKEATIGQGVSIPFSQVSASGVNTVFIEAKLELKVTPHVSADGSILLKIKATNNQPNPQLTGANGQPSISKREAETEVLVKDGETTVIGGIYTRVTSNRVAKVPFLGNLPLLGYFFRADSNQDDHTELLIFITPRIINRQGSAGAAGN